MKSCLIIAGEKSGEEHVQGFLTELKVKSPGYQFWGVGGDWMINHGVETLYHLNDFSSMGFSEVIAKLPFYKKAKDRIIQECKIRHTTHAILVDFQDFNLRLACSLNKIGIKVIYFVAPQAWAWRPSRAVTLAKNIHTLLCILPFEKEWFTSRGVDKVTVIPHPLQGRFKAFFAENENKLRLKRGLKLKNQFTILLLPGSRKLEIKYHLPVYLEAIRELKKEYKIKVLLSKSSNLDQGLFDSFASEVDSFIEENELAQAFLEADFSIATSGTVTLMAAFFELPTIICYRGSLFNQFIFENFINYQGTIGLANLVAAKKIFPELIQDEVSCYNIRMLVRHWIEDELDFLAIKNDLHVMRSRMPSDEMITVNCMAKVLEE